VLGTWLNSLMGQSHELDALICGIDGDLSDEQLEVLRSWKRMILLPIEIEPPESDNQVGSRRVARLREALRRYVLVLCGELKGNTEPWEYYAGAMLPTPEWILWSDCDVEIPSDAVEKLIETASRDDAWGASGVYASRHANVLCLGCGEAGDVPIEMGEIKPCRWTGMGCMVHRFELLKELSLSAYDDSDCFPLIGEDGYWCMQAHALTHKKLFADARVLCVHYTDDDYAVRVVER